MYSITSINKQHSFYKYVSHLFIRNFLRMSEDTTKLLFSCFICSSVDKLIHADEVDDNGIHWKSKLIYCIPQFDWNFKCFLCTKCTTKLNSLCNFHNCCISAHQKLMVSFNMSKIKHDSCSLPSDSIDTFNEHYKFLHHPETKCVCIICEQELSSFKILLEHEIEHLTYSHFRCSICKTYHKSESSLAAHEQFKHSPLDESQFVCSICAAKFCNNDQLSIHEQEIHNTEYFICFTCGKKYLQKFLLAEHIRSEHSSIEEHIFKKPCLFSCDFCHDVFSTKKKLEVHRIDCVLAINSETECVVENSKDIPSQVNNVADSKPTIKSRRRKKTRNKVQYKCEVCSCLFSTGYLLNRHVRNVHATDKSYKCDKCNQKFAAAVYLSAHKKYHSGSRPYVCFICGKAYFTKSDLSHHEKTHANKRAYRCEKCPKAFNTSSDLHKHRICVHSDRSLWKYECSYCERRFPLKTNLDTHVKTHTGEKNYACHLCDHRSINRSVLQRHIASHSNIRKFTCTQCKKEYKYQKSLDIHLAKVHGIGVIKVPERIKKYFCHICPKSYFANNKLQKHIRGHTGERPFSCPHCEKMFIDKSYVMQHIQTVHEMKSNQNILNI